MILEIECDYTLRGENFSPDLLIIPETIRVVHKRKLGDSIESGRFKESLSTEGVLIIEGNIDDILNFIESIKESNFINYVTESNICLTYCYQDQCNFELSQEHLRKFSILGIPLGITCYENKE